MDTCIQRSGHSGELIRGKVQVDEIDRGFVSGDVLHGDEIGWIDVVVVRSTGGSPESEGGEGEG